MSARTAPRLLLIDAYSLLFRAYLTPGPYFATSDGRPTGAVRGFANMLLTLLGQEQPDAIYVAWDAPGPTFRDGMFPAYKATRPEVAQDLILQFPVARQVVEAFGIPAAEAPGFEADDLVGTLARRGRDQGFDVVIVTGDSDQLQLVEPGVLVRMTRTGVTEMDTYDAERVRERYGIGPERVADFKALVGDTSDNIPGVAGVGKVTAAKLLQQYGSIDGLLARVDELPAAGARDRKVRDALVSGADQARLSLQLATIRRDAPADEIIRRYAPTADDWAKVREVFADLEFRTLASRLPELAPAAGAEPSEPTEAAEVAVAEICSAAELEAALAEVRAAGFVAIRTQCQGAPGVRAELVGLAFACDGTRAWHVRIAGAATAAPAALDFSDEAEQGWAAEPAALGGMLRDASIRVMAHDGKLDLLALAAPAIAPACLDFDTMLAAYVLQPGRSAYPLTELVSEHLGEAPAEGGDAATVLAREAAAIVRLRAPLDRRLEAEGLTGIMREIEMPLVPILAAMERTGVPVDRSWLEQLSAQMGRGIDAVAARIYELAGEEFLIGSTQQLQRILFEKLGLPSGKKNKTGYSTRADLLETLAPMYEIAARVLEYRELTKLKSTYADALPRLIHPGTGCIHTSLNQAVTATGRLSSSDPNLQNIPVRSEAGREIRKAFIAPPGQVLLSCDYSQIELRVFAHVTGDAEMVRAFEADEDIHAATATRLFGVDLDGVTADMRRRAKTVNFAVIYGQSDYGLGNTLGIPVGEAKAFIESYFELFPGVRTYTESTIQEARSKGYVQTLLGRRRYLPDIRSGNFNIRQGAERAAVNMPIQGTAADIMKLAMIAVCKHLQTVWYNHTLLLQVHDELVFAVDAAAAEPAAQGIAQVMEDACRLSVRLRVDAKVGPNWAEMRRL